MKLQSLSIIFIIIIMPISIVLSEYVNNKIQTEQTELLYNTRLLNSTYDAIKAYQLNTVNNAFGDVTNQKVKDIESAAKTFYNSLTSSFNYTGYKSEVMKEYVPALVYTMYDGYYTYSPFTNTLTNVEDSKYDTTYSQEGKNQEGLKPYVYYACRYVKGTTTDVTIIYTLDNYITVQGMIGGNYVYDSGYLYSIAGNKTDSNNGKGIYKDGSDYWYMGVKFSEGNKETMKEYVGKEEYEYAKINGKKYYLDLDYYNDGRAEKWGVFYIDSNGEKNYSQIKGISPALTDAERQESERYFNAIKNNKSAYEYYKNAYEFSSAVLGKQPKNDKAGNEWGDSAHSLVGLHTANAEHYSDTLSDDNKNITPLSEYGDFQIFDNSSLEFESSNFNKHRKAIIRYVIETNLSTSIAAFSQYSNNSSIEYIMPKISETDWETIENDVCAISFMQGMSIGSKKYNGYSVVANTLTKEFVDESDIYILTTDNTYCKVKDTTLSDENKIELNKPAGIWKLDFEQRQGFDDSGQITYYNPQEALGSYTSIMGSSGLEASTSGQDMYEFIKNANMTLKTVYLTALGRERWGSYNVNNVNYELYGNTNGNEYFLKDY